MKIFIPVFFIWFLCACTASKMVYKKEGLKVTVTQPAKIEKPLSVNISDKGAVEYVGPVSFSPETEAKGQAIIAEQKSNASNVRLYHLVSLACLITSLACAIGKHWIGSAVAFAGAFFAQVLRHFSVNEKFLTLSIVALGISFGLVSAYYILKRRGLVA